MLSQWEHLVQNQEEKLNFETFRETGRKLVGSKKHPRGIGDVEVDLAKYCILIPEILTWSLGKVFCTKDGEYPCGG